MRKWAGALTALALVGGLWACGESQELGSGNPPAKVFVCKYVGTPGVDETLQTGQNPISVSINAIPGGTGVGDSFADAQGRSLVIAFDTGQYEEPECPSPPTPTTAPPTTAQVTTTTGAATTTTCADCTPNTVITGTTTTVAGTTTTTTPAGTTTTSQPGTTTTVKGTTTTAPNTTITGPAQVFSFAGATTVCVREVPTIRITFGNTFPDLAGRTGTLTMTTVTGNGVVSVQPLVYQPGATVDILYPGTRVNPDGSIADVPGWTLLPSGLWIRDPSDAFLRDGIVLTYSVNPTATATVTYPPESSACANPKNPPTGTSPTPPPTLVPTE